MVGNYHCSALTLLRDRIACRPKTSCQLLFGCRKPSSVLSSPATVTFMNSVGLLMAADSLCLHSTEWFYTMTRTEQTSRQLPDMMLTAAPVQWLVGSVTVGWILQSGASIYPPIYQLSLCFRCATNKGTVVANKGAGEAPTKGPWSQTTNPSQFICW